MRTLEDIRGRCVIDGKHWLWKGSLRADGRANIYAPDYTRGGQLRVQTGMRAVWHCHTLAPIPEGYIVYLTCDEHTCCNPEHMRCETHKDYGKWVQSTGARKGKITHILANRAINRRRTKVTPEIIAEIRGSEETGRALAQRLGILETTVSKYRLGHYTSFASGGIFSGMTSL